MPQTRLVTFAIAMLLFGAGWIYFAPKMIHFLQVDACLESGNWWRHDEDRCEFCYDNDERYVGGPYCEEPAPTESEN